MPGSGDGIDAFIAFGPPVKGGETIQGETADVIERKVEEGWGRSIQIKTYSTSFALNTTNTEETHSQAGDVVAPEFEPDKVTIQKYVDAATPQLLKALRNAVRYQRVLISQRKAGGAKGRSGDYFWLIELKNVMISSLQWSSDESGATAETIALTYYDGISVEYYRQKSTGDLEKTPIWYEIDMTDTLQGKDKKNGKDGNSNGAAGGDLSESQLQTVTKRVLQTLKTKNPNLNIRL